MERKKDKIKQVLVRKGYKTPQRKQKLTRMKSVKPKLNLDERRNLNLISSLRKTIFTEQKLSMQNKLFMSTYLKDRIKKARTIQKKVSDIWNIPLHESISKIDILLNEKQILEESIKDTKDTTETSKDKKTQAKIEKINLKLIKEFFLLDSIIEKDKDNYLKRGKHLKSEVESYLLDCISMKKPKSIKDKILFTSKKITITVSFDKSQISYKNHLSNKSYVKAFDMEDFNLFGK